LGTILLPFVLHRKRVKKRGTVRYLIFLWLIAVTVAFVLRYALARFFLTVHSGDSSQGILIQNYAFWLVLAIAGLVTLVKLMRAR
jgi:hypothetical protein